MGKIWFLLGILTFIPRLAWPQLYINEFLASNASGGYYDAINNNYPDWIEIYNASETGLDLSNYFLTDDLTDLNKWKIPDGTSIAAKGYLLFLADDLDTAFHTNFKLKAAGETIGLSDANKKLLDSVVYLPQSTNISMGRMVDDPSVWAYFTQPSPNARNSSEAYSGKAMSPVYSQAAGFYDQAISLELSSPAESAGIRYTLDGSEPGSQSTAYTGPIDISSNTVVKAICLEEGLMDSEVISNTYFVNERSSLPVFSFSMPPALSSSFPFYSERAARVEYFNKAGTQEISQDIGVRITGLVGIHPMRSFSLYARTEYGKNRMEHRFFPSKTITSVKNLVLRNGGYQDYSYTYLRDGLIQSFVVDKLDLDYQAYQPVLVYKNGEFLALMNMREKMNEFYVENNHEVDKDSIDMLEYQTDPPMDVLTGDAGHFDAMMSFVESSDLSLEVNMEYLSTQMDVENFLDYYMLQIYCANADWPDKNSKIWRPKTPGGRWRWMIFDVDYGYGFAYPVDKNMYEYLYDLEEPFYHNRPWVTILFRKIMENENRRNYYLQRFCALLSTTFHSERALYLVDSLKAQIEPEILRHIDKWGSQAYGIPSLAAWQGHCEVLYDFATRRPQFARKNMMDFFGLEDTVALGIRSQGGTVYINDALFSKDSARGQFFMNVPLELRAVPDPGYAFVRWVNGPESEKPEISFTPDSPADIEAIFTPISSQILEESFTGDTVLSALSEPYIARGDLIIPPFTEVIFEEGIKLLMPEGCNIYVFGTLTIRGTKSNPVLIDAYSGNWGAICLNNSTGASEFCHLILHNASSGADPDLFPGAISAYHANLKLKGTIIENVPAHPVFSQYSDVWVDSCKFHSLGTCDLINVKYADTAIVENSVFMDSKSMDTDAIDFDEVKNGIIRNNKIFNLTGENSDGIDIGEGARDVNIYGNLIVNCSDKGISLGQASSMNVHRNVIYNCNTGIAIKDYGSYALIQNNTLVNNSIGISCYEKNLGSGAGSAFVINSILADSKISSLIERNEGEILVEYSLSNTDLLSGPGNQYGDPELANVHMLDFELLPGSACINAGSPDSPLDLDGSLADIGAYFVSDWSDKHQDLIINEFYSNSGIDDPEDWIEIYNKGNKTIDLSNWYVIDGGNDYFRLPTHSYVDSNSYVLICKDTSNFKEYYGADRSLYGNFDFSLAGSRDRISLFDSQYSPVKSLSYDEDHSWPDSKEKSRLSVAHIDSSLSMTEARNWRTAYKVYGTPGYSNIPSRVSGLFLNEVSGREQFFYPDNFGEYEDWIEIYNATGKEVNFGGLYLTDDLKDLTKHRVRANDPDSTTIAAYGFQVLFADGELDQGIHHLDFKISASGEELGLVQLVGLDTIVLDELVFGDFSPGFSLGRRTDGGAPWESQVLTPGSSNMASSFPVSEEIFAQVYPNPARDVLYISFSARVDGAMQISLVNAMGQVVLSELKQDLIPGQLVNLDVSTLRPGVYFLQLRSGPLSAVEQIVISH